jgi:hypothetical protein
MIIASDHRITTRSMILKLSGLVCAAQPAGTRPVLVLTEGSGAVRRDGDGNVGMCVVLQTKVTPSASRTEKSKPIHQIGSKKGLW